MQHFLFCVFKTLEGETYSEIPYHFTQYTVSLDDGVECDFDGYATQFVTAERCLTGMSTKFPYVVALEARDGQPFDADTRAHLMVSDQHPNMGNGVELADVRGYRRPNSMLDRFVALQIGRNRAIGRVSKQAIGGSVSGADLKFKGQRWGGENSLALKTGTPLTTSWFPVYSSLLSPYPEIDSFGRVGRGGIFQPLPEQIGDLVLCHASDYRARRRAFVRRAKTETAFMWAIDSAIRSVRQFMLMYELRMNQFSFLWGDGHIPAIGYDLLIFEQMSEVYFDLGVFLGYLQPEPPQFRAGYNSLEQGEALYPDSFYTIKLGDHSEAVQSLIQRLADNYEYGEANGLIDLYRNTAVPFPTYQQSLDHAATIYENWEIFMNWLQKSIDALLTLRVVVLVGEAWRAPNDPKPTTPVQRWGYYGNTPNAEPEPLAVTWFRELKLRDRGDFLSTPDESNVVVVSLPTVAPPNADVPLQWNDTIYPDDDGGFYITWYEWIAIVIAAILVLWLLGRFLGKERLAPREVPGEREALKVAFENWRRNGVWVHREIPSNSIYDFVKDRWVPQVHYWLTPP
jgi:hypothetical protein